MKTKNFFLTMIAMCAMLAMTSCSKVSEYFIVLDKASNNTVEYVFETAFGGQDYMSLGECEESEAVDAFDTFCSNLSLMGLGTATVSLREDSPTGSKVKTREVR